LSKTNVGRKNVLSENEVKEIIYKYQQEENVMGKIKSLEVYRFTERLYEKGEVNVLPSSDFWRRTGRLGKEKIDEANKVITHKFSTTEGKEIVVPSIIDLIYKHQKEPEKLIKMLLPFETQLDKSLTREKILKEKLDKQIEKNKELEDRFNQIQDLLFRFMRYSVRSDSNLRNLLNTGSTKTDFVLKAADLMFKDYYWFKELEDSDEESSLININDHKDKPKLLKDTLKSRFNTIKDRT
jgi:hypothetical protein